MSEAKKKENAQSAPAAAPLGAAVVLSATCPNKHVVEVRGSEAHQAAAEVIAQLASSGILALPACSTCGTRVKLEVK